MKIRFLKSCAGVGFAYKKGEVRDDVDLDQAKQFIKDGLAVQVKERRTTASARAKKAEKTVK